MKKCIKCGLNKEVTADNFHRSKAQKDGHINTCRDCKRLQNLENKENKEKNKVYRKKYYEKNKEKMRKRSRERYQNLSFEEKENYKEYQREYGKVYFENKLEENPDYYKEIYKNNIDYHKEHAKRHYAENKEELQELSRDYYHDNKDKVKEYREANRDAIRESQTRWASENKEYLVAWRREYHEENKERINERRRLHQKNNPEISRASRQRYRARKRSLPYTLTEKQWNETLIYFNDKCCYCGVENDLQRDHFIALTRGGGYTKENIVPACAYCNQSKNNKDFFEWYPTTDFYDSDREEKILTHLKFDRNKNKKLTIV